ncbi:AsmA-like C-terminal region-containing protein [Fodinicurvata halophila]
MNVQGPMQLGSVQGTADWREVFAGQGVRTRVQAEIPRFNQEDWEIVGFDPSPYLSGPVSAGLTARLHADERVEVEVRGDLGDAGLHVPELDWRKPAGESGEITASLVLQGERFLGVEDFKLTTADLQAAGVVTMDESGEDIQEAALSDFVLGRSNLQDVVVRTPQDGTLEVVLGSGQLDLLPLLEESSQEDNAAAPENGEDAVSPDLVVRTPGLSRVYFSEDRYFEDLSLEAERRDGIWLYARGQAELSGGQQGVADSEDSPGVPIPEGLHLTYGPQESGKYALELTASDMGALLQALGLTEGIRGGAMRISGESEGPYPEEPMNVRLWSQDFRLVNAPAMAQLLTVASLTGIADLMSGEGIGFQRLHGEAIIYESQITSDLIQANGPALGITARGRLDMEGDETDIRGSLVPAYSVNSMLGSIPVLGDLLTGGEGEGILGVSYVVTGSMDDPEIAVNPLSFLAPGFLRQLFNIAPDTSPPETNEEPEPEAEQMPEESPDPSANPGRPPSMGR